MVVWFRDGGVFMYPILATIIAVGPLAFIALIVAIASRIKPGMAIAARILTLLIFLASLGGPCFGCMGWMQRRSLTEQAVIHAPPEMKETMRAMGYQISRIPLNFGMCGGGGLVTAPALLALLIAMAPVRRDYAAMAEED